jgi:hypothetical protein
MIMSKSKSDVENISISIVLPVGLADRLMQAAKADDRSVSSMARRCIEQVLKSMAS